MFLAFADGDVFSEEVQVSPSGSKDECVSLHSRETLRLWTRK